MSLWLCLEYDISMFIISIQYKYKIAVLILFPKLTTKAAAFFACLLHVGFMYFRFEKIPD